MKRDRLQKEEIGWLNSNVDMRPYMELHGVEIRQNGQCFCPFHDNHSTPAGKFFDNSNSMYCFTEGRTYRTYNILKLMGWDAEEMRKLIPDDFKYEEEHHVQQIPRISPEIREKFRGRPFVFLREMNKVWNAMNDEKTKHLVDKIIL